MLLMHQHVLLLQQCNGASLGMYPFVHLGPWLRPCAEHISRNAWGPRLARP